MSGEHEPGDGAREHPSAISTHTFIAAFRGFLEKLVRAAAVQLDAQISERKDAIKIADNLVEVLDCATGADE